jgi:glutaredoxin 3
MIETIEIYTKDNCPYCEKAKALMRDRQLAFYEFKLDVDCTREFILEKFSGATTFPVIVLDGFYIGGYTEFVTQLNEDFKNTKKLLNG